jgi:hypothetical protein
LSRDFVNRKLRTILPALRHSLIAIRASALLLLASAARAQAPESFSDVPERFRLELGGFRIGSDTELTFSSSGGPRPPVNFESLQVPENATRGYVEGFWRPWRRHEFSLSWYRNNREGDSVTLQRDVTWGDRVIAVGSTVQGQVHSTYLSGVYRFAAYKNDRFEIGPSLGIGHLSLAAGLSGNATATGAGGSVSGPFDISPSMGHVTGDLGGYLYYWPARRLLLRGDMRYIIVKPGNSEASVTDGRAALVFYPSRHVGIGIQYTYTKFRYDRDIVSTEIGGSLRFSGGQLVLSTAF